MSGEAYEQAAGRDGPEPTYVVCDVEEVHPQWSEVRPGVNYVAAWRETRLTAGELCAALSGAGLGRSEAFARVRADGSPVVCLELEPNTARALAELIDGALRERQEGAPKIRGAPQVA